MSSRVFGPHSSATTLAALNSILLRALKLLVTPLVDMETRSHVFDGAWGPEGNGCSGEWANVDLEDPRMNCLDFDILGETEQLCAPSGRTLNGYISLDLRGHVPKSGNVHFPGDK